LKVLLLQSDVVKGFSKKLSTKKPDIFNIPSVAFAYIITVIMEHVLFGV